MRRFWWLLSDFDLLFLVASGRVFFRWLRLILRLRETFANLQFSVAGIIADIKFLSVTDRRAILTDD